ncbi:hypothetical protein I5R69_25580 [Serratia marcescens]|nr:hypothetical protein [Serratia marcescens]
MKKIQLAKIYSGDLFKGFGIAVDGELLEQQVFTTIESSGADLPKLIPTFYLEDEQVENAIRVQV